MVVQKKTSEYLNKHATQLPNDFADYFKTVNGMDKLYPNASDENGFLFYPLNRLEIIQNDAINYLQHTRAFVFANYMQRCWEYYVIFQDQNNYEIGIKPTSNKFKYITNSLADFIEYYIEDDKILYTY